MYKPNELNSKSRACCGSRDLNPGGYAPICIHTVTYANVCLVPKCYTERYNKIIIKQKEL